MFTRRVCLQSWLPVLAPTSALSSPAFIAPRAPRAAPKRLRTLFDDAHPGESPVDVMNRNFLPSIDYSLSRYSPKRVRRVVDGWTELELDALSRAMHRAYMDYGREGAAMDLLASGLDAKRLVRISRAFGFAPVYAAITRTTPDKAHAFLSSADPNWMGPAAGRRAPLSNIHLDHTIEQIFLSFRNAPIGSLSVTASIYMTATTVGAQLSGAFGMGYAVGTGINALINVFAPELGNSIGQQLFNMMNHMQQPAPAPGEAQRDMGLMLDFPAAILDGLEHGGDFDSTAQWAELEGYGGGGGSPCLECAIV